MRYRSGIISAGGGQRVSAFIPILALLGVILPGTQVAAQTSYLLQTGSPTFTTRIPVELGSVNLANGNLHLEIPIASPPERGGVHFAARLIYDSRIWTPVSGSWQPTNIPNSWGGWRFATTADAGQTTNTAVTTSCGVSSYTTYSPFFWTAPDGTQHVFPITTVNSNCTGVNSVASGHAYVDDSTGYYMTVTNYTVAKVYADDGTIVSDATQSAYTVKDPNGNYFSLSGANVVDTLGRTVVSVSNSGNQYDYDVLNSQGSTSRYSATTESINVKTAFGQSGVSEYSGTLTVVSSLALPDGTSYSFTYDGYGELATVTLRTGSQVTYEWTNFSDSYGNINRWLDTRAAGGGTWTYAPSVITTCQPSGTGCQQKITMTKPSGDDAVYTFTLNNGAWNTETQYYTGSSNLLRTVTTIYDFSNSCPVTGCVGAAYIRPTQVNTADASSGATLNQQTQYAYDSIAYGNVKAFKEWNYYTGSPGSTPDRETDYTYITSVSYIGKNILNRVTDRVVKGGGAKAAEAVTTYDSTGLTSVTGVTHHDDANYGSGDTVRGNPTVVGQWVSGSTYLSTTSYYDTTGQRVKMTDPAGNPTSYSFADRFYNDNGSNPPQSYSPSQATNAYLTQTTLPVSGTLKYGYYFGSGMPALSTDQNGQSTYLHYADPLGRQTQLDTPTGWTLTAYTSATETDRYTGLTDTTPSTGCSGCRHDQMDFDSLGRLIDQVLVNDPQGATTTATAYDSSGRVSSRSNPYRSTSDPTYGLQTEAYDGLDRATSETLPDSNVVYMYYGPSVTGGGGISSQLCSGGIGFPTLTVDAAGNKQQMWRDAFGRVVEVDQFTSNGGPTLGTCYTFDALNDLTGITQGTQTRSYGYDGLSRKTSETTPEAGTVSFSYTASGGGLCSGNPRAVCTRTDARSVTTTYAYDAENRLTSKTYSDSTPAAYFSYDESSVTVSGSNYTITNGKGRPTHATAAGGNAITIQSYDPSGRIQDIWECTPYNCSSSSIWNQHVTYNEAGDVTSWTHPAGVTITNAVSDARRITQITSSLSDSTHPGTLATITYAPQGAVATLTNGCVGTGCNQIQETYAYNNRLQTVMIELGTASSPAADSCQVYNYYSNVSNPTSCSTPTQGAGNDGNAMGNLYQDTSTPALGYAASFTYDPTMRLTSAVATPLQQHGAAENLAFSYDHWGNMTCVQNKQTNGPCPQLSFSSSTNQITNQGYSYDASGDLTADGTHTYQWDAEGRLISVDKGSTASYVYDASGERVEKVVGGNYTEYFFNAQGEAVGENNRSAWTEDYFPFQGRHFAHYANGGADFIHVNNIGTAGQSTDYTGAVVQDLLRYPWGQDWLGAAVVEARFASLQHRDTETSFDPTHYRMYASTEGRWLSPDPVMGCPLHPENFDRYAYAGNNPVNLTDPLGNFLILPPPPPPQWWGCDPFGDCYYGYLTIFVPIPCPGTISCQYYQTMCNNPAVKEKWYYCKVAPPICSYGGEFSWSNCVRLCLQTNDVCYRQTTLAGFLSCIAVLHINCFDSCFQQCFTEIEIPLFIDI